MTNVADSGETWPWLDRLRILCDVAEGVWQMHAKRYIHRDLKSDNVLIDEHGRAKVADLGLARSDEAFDVAQISSLEQRQAETAKMHWSFDGGTPAYMAPDVIAEYLLTHGGELAFRTAPKKAQSTKPTKQGRKTWITSKKLPPRAWHSEEQLPVGPRGGSSRGGQGQEHRQGPSDLTLSTPSSDTMQCGDPDPTVRGAAAAARPGTSRRRRDDYMLLVDEAKASHNDRWASAHHPGRKISMRSKSSWHAPDAYAFGVILWEVLTLRVPWAPETFPHRIWRRVQAGERPELAAADLEGAPEGYAALMRELWAQDPVVRPTFAEALRRLEAMHAVHAAAAEAAGESSAAGKSSVTAGTLRVEDYAASKGHAYEPPVFLSYTEGGSPDKAAGGGRVQTTFAAIRGGPSHSVERRRDKESKYGKVVSPVPERGRGKDSDRGVPDLVSSLFKPIGDTPTDKGIYAGMHTASRAYTSTGTQPRTFL